MTDADSIRESKLSRLQDPNPEKMKPLVGLMGELRERRQERGEPRPGPQALRRARGAGPGGGGYSVDDYILTPIVPCSVCDARYVEDPTRDGMGRQLPEENLVERDWQPRCESCQQQAFGEAFDEDTLDAVGRKLGITEENKGTLEALIYIMDNQDRVMMVAHAQQRVDELERRLEDRTASLRDLVESKLENANSRLFVSSLITNAALFLCGLLFGIVVALLFGG